MLLGASLTGCGNDMPSEGPEPTPSASERQLGETVDDLSRNVKELGQQVGTVVEEKAEAAAETLEAERRELIQTVEARLHEAREALPELRRKAAEGSQDVRAHLGVLGEKLEEQSRQLEIQLDRIADAGAESWEGAKQDLNRALKTLSQTVNEARQELKSNNA
jgi:exonuclease VII large subunit